MSWNLCIVVIVCWIRRRHLFLCSCNNSQIYNQKDYYTSYRTFVYYLIYVELKSILDTSFLFDVEFFLFLNSIQQLSSFPIISTFQVFSNVIFLLLWFFFLIPFSKTFNPLKNKISEFNVTNFSFCYFKNLSVCFFFFSFLSFSSCFILSSRAV